jgi:PIN domain-containing protein
VPIPNVTHAMLLDRELARTKPFSLDGKGYRDALIWLGFLSTIDTETQEAIFVTSNSKDFCNTGANDLHPDLLKEIQNRKPGCSACIYLSPNALVEHVVKPQLQGMAEEEAKAQEILNKIKLGEYQYFDLTEVVTAALDTFELQEAAGPFYADGVSLEEPIWVSLEEHIWVTTVDAPEYIEATFLLRLANGKFVCEGTAQVSVTVEGFLDKWEAFYLSEEGKVYISDPDWNDHYSEVEMSEVPPVITYSFEFAPESSEISNFE